MIDNYPSVVFNLVYLAIIWSAIISAYTKAPKKKTPEWKMVFGSFLLLGFGDIFHLITRTIIFFMSLNWDQLGFASQAAYYNQSIIENIFGFGLIATSITVQFFYLGMYFYWRAGEYKKYEVQQKIQGKNNPFFGYDIVATVTTITRLVLIAYPQNHWGEQTTELNPVRIITNIPLYIIGILVLVIFFKRSADKEFQQIEGFSINDRKMIKNVAIWILVSFFCYSLTIFFTVVNPLFGMAMIPKTIAYLVALLYFYKGLLKKKSS